MKLGIIGISTTDEEVIKKTTKEKLDMQGGHSANICYTQKDWNEIIAEPEEKVLPQV